MIWWERFGGEPVISDHYLPPALPATFSEKFDIPKEVSYLIYDKDYERQKYFQGL